MDIISFKGLDFGYADAEKELSRDPELFDSAFFDPANHLEKIVNGSHFLIIGRKGTGKTAYSAKMRRIAEHDKSILVRASSLSRLDYTLFEEFCDSNVLGGRRYSSTWEYLLLIEFLKMIEEDVPECQNEMVLSVMLELHKLGILSCNDLVHTIKTLSKKGIKLALPGFFEGEYGKEKEYDFYSDASKISEFIMKAVQTLAFGTRRFYIIIDGLDDSLRGKKFSSDIITGLLRAGDYINNLFYRKELNLKVVILLRTDIMAQCRDPDMNKICRDSAVKLNWIQTSLNEVILKRIQRSLPQVTNYNDFWYAHFPHEFLRRDSMKRVYECTLLRPRDILQFFIECKVQTGGKNRYRFEVHDLYEIVGRYSAEYFVSEMQDELTGFLPDDAINMIPDIFSKLERSQFQVPEFERISRIKELDKMCNPIEVLEMLFNGGYIGQSDKNGSFAFKHINPLSRFESDKECIVHRGLRKAFNVY